MNILHAFPSPPSSLPALLTPPSPLTHAYSHVTVLWTYCRFATEVDGNSALSMKQWAVWVRALIDSYTSPHHLCLLASSYSGSEMRGANPTCCYGNGTHAVLPSLSPPIVALLISLHQLLSVTQSISLASRPPHFFWPIWRSGRVTCCQEEYKMGWGWEWGQHSVSIYCM